MADSDVPRIVYLAHDSPGRLRLRLNWLREAGEDAGALADAVAAVPGVEEVAVRPFTGSVLVTYDPARTDGAAVQRALCAASGVEDVTLPGHESVAQIRQLLRGSHKRGSDLVRVAVRAFQRINVDVLRETNGHVSLGSLTSLLLWTGAATKLISSPELPLPEWHQMAWWGFRSFATLEESAIEKNAARTLDELWEDVE